MPMCEQFKVTEVLGQGHFSSVYHAKVLPNSVLNGSPSFVAIKTMKKTNMKKYHMEAVFEEI